MLTVADVSALLKPSRITAQDFSSRAGLPGFSDDMMRLHLDLYQGYVDATNSLMDLLGNGRVPKEAARELQRRLGWEYNGVRLHEVYFGALSTDPAPGPQDQTATVIEGSYGDIDAWWEAFSDVAKSRGIGWAILTYDPVADQVLNTWVDEHDIGVLAGTTPLVVTDLFEHAYLRQFRTDRRAYLDAFREALDWDFIEARLAQVRRA